MHRYRVPPAVLLQELRVEGGQRLDGGFKLAEEAGGGAEDCHHGGRVGIFQAGSVEEVVGAQAAVPGKLREAFAEDFHRLLPLGAVVRRQVGVGGLHHADALLGEFAGAQTCGLCRFRRFCGSVRRGAVRGIQLF